MSVLEGYFPFPVGSEPRAFWRCPVCGLVRLEEYLPTAFIPRTCPMHRRAGEEKPEMVRFEILAVQVAPRQPRSDGPTGRRVYMRIGDEDSKLHIYSGHGGDLNALRPVAVCGRRGALDVQLLCDVDPDDRNVCGNCLRDVRLRR